jgi:hypothetical protein
MRRVLSIVLLAVALLGSSLMLTSANADRDDKNGGESFRVVTITKQFGGNDAPPKGDSVGDTFAFSDDVFFGKKRVGYLDGNCTLTRVDKKTKTVREHCAATMTLPGGQITVQAALEFVGEETEGGTLAVTGGTGRYVGAEGEAHVTFVSDTKTIVHVVLED